MWRALHAYFFFFFNDTATTEIYTLSLHDALPISEHRHIVVLPQRLHRAVGGVVVQKGYVLGAQDRKSTRLNSSHANISYAVFCLKKKNNEYATSPPPPSSTIHSPPTPSTDRHTPL